MWLKLKKIITDLPDKIDPVELLKAKALICPFCKANHSYYGENGSNHHYYKNADKNGKTHTLLIHLNKYRWQKTACRCGKCGAMWTTEWYPVDHDYFTVEVGDDDNVEVWINNEEVGDDDGKGRA